MKTIIVYCALKDTDVTKLKYVSLVTIMQNQANDYKTTKMNGHCSGING